MEVESKDGRQCANTSFPSYHMVISQNPDDEDCQTSANRCKNYKIQMKKKKKQKCKFAKNHQVLDKVE